MRHISKTGDIISFMFRVVIDYLFMICSGMIFDKPILFQARYTGLTIWEHVDQPLKLS